MHRATRRILHRIGLAPGNLMVSHHWKRQRRCVDETDSAFLARASDEDSVKAVQAGWWAVNVGIHTVDALGLAPVIEPTLDFDGQSAGFGSLAESGREKSWYATGYVGGL